MRGMHEGEHCIQHGCMCASKRQKLTAGLLGTAPRQMVRQACVPVSKGMRCLLSSSSAGGFTVYLDRTAINTPVLACLYGLSATPQTPHESSLAESCSSCGWICVALDLPCSALSCLLCIYTPHHVWPKAIAAHSMHTVLHAFSMLTAQAADVTWCRGRERVRSADGRAAGSRASVGGGEAYGRASKASGWAPNANGAISPGRDPGGKRSARPSDVGMHGAGLLDCVASAEHKRACAEGAASKQDGS